MSPSKVSTISWDSFHNTVDGQARNSKSKHRGINPATGEELWEVPIGNQQDIDDAVKSAQNAFETWSQTPLEKRKDTITKFRDHYMSFADELIDLMCQETGKPRQFATYEVKGAAGFFDHHLALDIPEERIEDDEKVLLTRFTPLGVVGAICPWNFPIILCLGKVIPALLTGNTIIVKPSPYTPYTTLKIVELAQEIFAPGVVQAVGGDDKLGPMLTTHPGVAKISFTGSIATGKKVMAAASGTLKRVTLELGGNDASIVLPDVDIKKVAPELVMGAFQNSGQVCVATKRIYIHEDIYDEMLKEMVNFTKTIKVGDPSSGSLLGPIQNKMQYEKVKTFFEDSKSHGYKFAVGEPEVSRSKGYFVQPTIIDNPPNDSRIIQEEPFGPIVPTQPWSDEEEVIKRANNTNAGLGACVWGKDVERAERIGKRLQAGSVFVNSWEKPTPQAIFGGHKESGIGGEWGTEGLKSYCNAHVLHTYKSNCNIYVSASPAHAAKDCGECDTGRYHRTQHTWLISVEPHKHHMPFVPQHKLEPTHFSANWKDDGYHVHTHSTGGVIGTILVKEGAKGDVEHIQQVLQAALKPTPANTSSNQTPDDENDRWVKKGLHALQTDKITDTFDLAEFMTFAHGANRLDSDAPARIAYPGLHKDHKEKSSKHHFWLTYPTKAPNGAEPGSRTYGGLM
ncbi:hypothetical protein LTR56_009119 [Elasticomyces elasticus]|nr:hypothetical protein LTR56_009119 [Elasticomyces elasticus]KAK3660644.1 hypothetical protein LTR22_007891 [Elasticomyces elasticus]KAK4915554.1 hypothetical protein LTR49_016277 [Elasticomyces elasticus]KAK5755081.1 hypothetical protein LTS12_014881 [Elasticomyces elasticus]